MLAFVLLVVIDVGHVAVDIHLNLLGAGSRWAHEVQRDRSYAEFHQYSKLTWAGLVILVTAWTTRVWQMAVWVPLFVLLFATDAFRLHEQLGWSLAASVDLPTPFGLHPGDLGEVIVGVAFASLTAIGVVLGWRRASRTTRRFHLRLTALVGALAVFGVALDALGTLLPSDTAKAWWSRVEDGGEMVMVSLIAAFLVQTWAVLAARRDRPVSPIAT